MKEPGNASALLSSLGFNKKKRESLVRKLIMFGEFNSIVSGRTDNPSLAFDNLLKHYGYIGSCSTLASRYETLFPILLRKAMQETLHGAIRSHAIKADNV